MSDTQEYRGHTITVEQVGDMDGFNPREDCNTGTMVCGHRNYILGDEQFSDMDYFSIDCEDCEGTGYGNHANGERAFYGDPLGSPTCPKCEGEGYLIDPIRWAKETQGARVVLPLYLMDHSGISMRTSAFSCPWDSGQVGIAFDTPAGIENTQGKDAELTDEQITEILVSEVQTYDDYLTGDVYRYEIKGPYCDESCDGFFPDHSTNKWPDQIDYIWREARSEIDASIKWEQEQSAKIASIMAL